MTELNKSKLSIILTVMVAFTMVNIIKDNNWIGYLISIIILPLITWAVIEIMIILNR